MESSNIFFIAFNIKKEFGGMTNSFLKRSKLFNEKANLNVNIVTFAMDYELRKNLEYINHKIGNKTKIINMYEFYSQQLFDSTDTTAHKVEEQGYFIYKYDGKEIYDYFKNGHLEFRKNFEDYDGKLSSKIYFNNELNKYKKEEFDTNGYLRKTIYYNTTSDKMIKSMLYRLDGSIYMTKHYRLQKDNIDGKEINTCVGIYVFDKQGNSISKFKSDIDLKNNFLDQITNQYKHNFFIIDSSYKLEDMKLYKNEKNEVYKIYMSHNCHTKYPYYFDSEIRSSIKCIYDDIYNHDAIVSLTKKQQNDIKKRYSKVNNIHLIPHSINTSTSILDKLKLNKRDYSRIICVARIDQQKQLDHAIKSFSIVVKKMLNAKLEIYGIEGDVKRETLESLIKELNLENNVFLMGYTNNIKDIYN
ncbi:MAG: alpha-glucosyltransferase N-terminal domain-containing protein, partial [Peptostreptococcaceae bacterium]